jgi:hypothetical protein
MSEQEIQQKYSTLAAQVGDLYFKMRQTEAVLEQQRRQMLSFETAKRELEAQLKTLQEAAPHVEASTSPD